MPKARHPHTNPAPDPVRENAQTEPAATSPLAADEIKALRDTAGWRA